MSQTPPKMLAFLNHFNGCQKCKEHDRFLNLCSDGDITLTKWMRETEDRVAEGVDSGFDGQQILQELRFFGKCKKDEDGPFVGISKGEILAVLAYVKTLEADNGELAQRKTVPESCGLCGKPCDYLFTKLCKNEECEDYDPRVSSDYDS